MFFLLIFCTKPSSDSPVICGWYRWDGRQNQMTRHNSQTKGSKSSVCMLLLLLFEPFSCKLFAEDNCSCLITAVMSCWMMPSYWFFHFLTTSFRLRQRKPAPGTQCRGCRAAGLAGLWWLFLLSPFPEFKGKLHKLAAYRQTDVEVTLSPSASKTMLRCS